MIRVPMQRVGSRQRAGASAESARGPPRGHAAVSHKQNDQYMQDWEQAYAALHGPSARAALEAPKRVNAPSHSASSHGISALPLEYDALQVARGWEVGPVDPAGTVLDLSDRPVLCSALSPDGSEVALGCSDHSVYTVDLRRRRKGRHLYTRTHGHREWVTCLAYTPQGQLISGAMDSKLCIWDARGSRCVDCVGHSGSVSAVTVATSGRDSVVISGAYDRTVRLWSTRGQELCCLKGHRAPILSLHMCDDGVCLTGDRDGLAMAWDLNAQSHVGTLRGHKGHVTSALGLCDGTGTAVTGGQDGHVRIWDLRAQSEVLNIACHTNSAGSGAVGGLQRCGSQIVSMGADNSICLIDLRSNQEPIHRWTEHRYVYTRRVHCTVCEPRHVCSCLEQRFYLQLAGGG